MPTTAPVRPPLRLGDLEVATPVVLAPMAGVTNAAFRQLCAEQGAGLYVCEMITSRGIVEGDPVSLRDAQLRRRRSRSGRCSCTASTPSTIGKAVGSCAREYGVDHVDLNFGCPVPKVTRKGGGAALPWKATLLGRDPHRGRPRRPAVRGPGDDEDAQGHRRRPPDVPRRRTHRPGRRLRRDRAARSYGGAALLRACRLGVDRRRSRRPSTSRCSATGTSGRRPTRSAMVEQTGVDGVVVGRGCLGRPWLFRDLAAAFAGEHADGAADLGGGRRRGCAAMPSCSAADMGEERGLHRVPQAHRVVPQGLRAPAARCVSALGDDSTPAPTSTTLLGRPRPRPSRTPRRSSARHADARAARSASRFPTAGSTSREVARIDPAAEDATSGG